MAERPILFSAPMVRALLACTKSQTRRAVKPVGDDDSFVLQDDGNGWWPFRSDDGESPMKDCNEIPHRCPYGQPGDRLWVRETWLTVNGDDTFYRADHLHDPAGDRAHGVAWKPSIHMPRSRSRITLEVIRVRVERLQDISEAEATAEGAEPLLVPPDGGSAPHVEGYRVLWDQINGAGAWAANPWVWVIEFKRETP